MNGIKSIFTSTTFWGAVVSFTAGLLPLLFKWITSSDVASFVSVATNLISAIGGVVGFAITIYGRWKASQTVSLLGARK